MIRPALTTVTTTAGVPAIAIIVKIEGIPDYREYRGDREQPYDRHRHYLHRDYRGRRILIAAIGAPGINGTGTHGVILIYTDMAGIIARAAT